MHGWDWYWNGEWPWDWSPAAIAGVVIGSLIALAIGILVWYFFLRNLRDLLNQVSEQNRAMPPGHVWLNFIPIFNLGWIIYTVIKVRDSVRAEYQARGWPAQDDFGYGVGLAYGILNIASVVLGVVPALGGIIGIAQLVCWILYWVKTNRLKSQLVQGVAPVGYAPPPQYPLYPGPGGQPMPPGQGVEGERFPGAQNVGSQSPEAPGPGEPGEPAAHCPYCGATYRSGARFCSVCGRPAA